MVVEPNSVIAMRGTSAPIPSPISQYEFSRLLEMCWNGLAYILKDTDDAENWSGVDSNALVRCRGDVAAGDGVSEGRYRLLAMPSMARRVAP